MLGSGHGLFLLGRTEKTTKNFRQVFRSVVAETDRGHLVCYRIPFCIVPLCVTAYHSASCHCVLPHTILHRAIAHTVAYIYDCDCDR